MNAAELFIFNYRKHYSNKIHFYSQTVLLAGEHDIRLCKETIFLAEFLGTNIFPHLFAHNY
jgi:hypothetical protein